LHSHVSIVHKLVRIHMCSTRIRTFTGVCVHPLVCLAADQPQPLHLCRCEAAPPCRAPPQHMPMPGHQRAFPTRKMLPNLHQWECRRLTGQQVEEYIRPAICLLASPAEQIPASRVVVMVDLDPFLCWVPCDKDIHVKEQLSSSLSSFSSE